MSAYRKTEQWHTRSEACGNDSATGRTFTYLWSVRQAGNPSFQLPDETVVTEPNFTFTPQAVGTYDVTLVVTDNLGATAQASFVLNVTPQLVSVALSGGPISATPFTTITLTGTVETASGTSLTGAPAWSATLHGQPFALPPGGKDAAGQPTLSFVVPGPGTYAVHLSAANNTGGTGSGTSRSWSATAWRSWGCRPTAGRPCP